ncbi:MAG TPA: ABC transporter substrate-binding protein [Ilumatobacteraceae bacterium]|nr:ABC transporter substrate-binding protein [Ilumatobacteraceae bacterium]
MQISRVKRVGALLVGLTLVAAACGSDEEASPASEAPAAETTEAAAGTTEAEPETTEAAAETTEAAATEGETVQAAPTCTGESDGVLNIATVLPETGNLAFLGPPEFAGAELAIADINEAGGALGADVTLDQGDSGDTSTDIANQTVDRQLAAGADAFIGAASSGVSFTFIDKLVENCKIHFSPANTSPDFTEYDEDGLYFRTAPSDVLQGRVLADLMIEEGVTTATFMALQDPYGEGLLKYSTEPFADQGGEIVEQFTYDPQAAEFSAEVDKVVSGDPEALVIIGFEETAKILTSLFEAGYTPESGKKIYLVDGNVGNALGAALPAGSMEGIRGTLPAAEITGDFKDRLLEVDPELIDFSYGPETYDAVIIVALAAQIAGTDDPAAVAGQINGATRDGEVCTTYADCVALIDAGTDIDYDGPSGPQSFGPEGEPTEASFAILTYDAENTVGTSVPTEFKFAKI